MNGQAGTRVLVVGSGAIGGVTAAHLRHAGVDVTSLVTNLQTQQALANSGYRLRGHTSLRQVGDPQVLERAADGRAESFDFALLAVQPPQVEQAVVEIAPLLRPDARVVCFQNGLCEERIANIVGAERVLGGIVAWGASMPEPGLFDKTSAGGFTLGRLTGPLDPACYELGNILSSVGPVTYTSNLIGARFSKLAINCAVSTLGTLGGTNVGGLLNHPFVRRLALEIITEACDVAAALGVHIEKLATTVDVRWFALRADEARRSIHPSLLTKHALVYAVGRKYRRMRSSMLQAIERGRPPAVDFLNGELVTRGERLGIAVPVNTRARELVWQVARRERDSSMSTLRQLFADTASDKSLG
jgi:2-dehydropantoate 2-reductase